MTVKCPNCEWSAEVPDEKIPAGGGKGTCPKCQTKFEVKKEAKLIIEPPPVLSSPTHSDTKPCPLCGEEILNIAKKCKHCKSMLVDALESKPNEEPILSSHQGFKNITDFGKCSDCGESLGDDRGFCAKCGVIQVSKSKAGYVGVVSGDPRDYRSHFSPPPAKAGGSNSFGVIKTTLTVIITIAVVAILGRIFVYYVSGEAAVSEAISKANESETRARELRLLYEKSR